MKKQLLFSLLLGIPLLSIAQWDMPEPAPSEIKTEFRHSYFQANYRLQKAMQRCLEEDADLISPKADSVRFTAIDLYYEGSTNYVQKRELPQGLKQESFHTEAQKVEVLKKQFALSPQQLKSLGQRQQLNSLYSLALGTWQFRKIGRRILASTPLTKDHREQLIYEYKFDRAGQLLSFKFGRLGSFGDTLFWNNYRYHYQNENLLQSSHQRCRDLSCRKGYELEIIQYDQGKLREKLFQTFSPKGNQLAMEQKWQYHYSEEELDSVTSQRFNILNDKPILYGYSREYYKDQMIRSSKEIALMPQAYVEVQKSVTTNYRYDAKDRLIEKSVQEYDAQKKKLIEAFKEVYEYSSNAFVYRYKESYKEEYGREILPLQFDLKMAFY